MDHTHSQETRWNMFDTRGTTTHINTHTCSYTHTHTHFQAPLYTEYQELTHKPGQAPEFCASVHIGTQTHRHGQAQAEPSAQTSTQPFCHSGGGTRRVGVWAVTALVTCNTHPISELI